MRGSAARMAGPPKLDRLERSGGAIRRKLVLRGDSLGHAGPIVQRVRRTRGKAGRPPLAIPHRLGLDPVLAERREVDHQVGRIEQPLSYVYELSCHAGQPTGSLGRNRQICRRNCSPG
jgi:hypothetical protein